MDPGCNRYEVLPVGIGNLGDQFAIVAMGRAKSEFWWLSLCGYQLTASQRSQRSGCSRRLGVQARRHILISPRALCVIAHDQQGFKLHHSANFFGEEFQDLRWNLCLRH